MLLSVYNIKKRDLNLLNGKLWLKRYFYWNKNLSFNGIWISTQAQRKWIVSWCHFIPPIFYSISNLINICIIPIYFLVGLWGCEACCPTVFFTPHIQYESFFPSISDFLFSTSFQRQWRELWEYYHLKFTQCSHFAHDRAEQPRQYHIQQIHFLFYFVLLIKLIMFVITQSFPLIVFAKWWTNAETHKHIPDQDYIEI